MKGEKKEEREKERSIVRGGICKRREEKGEEEVIKVK